MMETFKTPGGGNENFKNKKRELVDRIIMLYEQEGSLGKKLAKELSACPQPLTIKKQDLIEDPYDLREILEPEDPIEIKIEPTLKISEYEDEKEFPGLDISVRNRRIAESSSRQKFAGVVEKGTTKELEDFIDRIEIPPVKVGYIGELKTMLGMMQTGQTHDHELLAAKDEASKVVGIAIVKKGKKDAHVAAMVVDPSIHSTGVGSAILAKLKTDFDSIDLVPIPKTVSETVQYDTFLERLKIFYKRNGFVNARYWSRNIVSVDDETESGNWRNINSQAGIYHSLGINKKSISTKNVSERLYTAILASEQLRASIPPSVVADIQKWKEIFDEKESLKKELEKLEEQNKGK